MVWVKKTLLCILFSPVFLVIGIILLCGKVRIHHCRKQVFLNFNVEMFDAIQLGEFVRIFIILLNMKHYKTESIKCINGETCALLAKNHHKSVMVVISQKPENLPADLPQILKAESPVERVVLVTNSVFPIWLSVLAKQHHFILINRDKLHRFIGLLQQHHFLKLRHYLE